MVEDITERKQTEEALQRSNDMLRAIIEAAPTAIIGLDLDGHMHSVWNSAAEEMLGGDHRSAVFEIYHPDCLDLAKKTLKELLEQGEVHDKELQLRRNDGSK